MKLNTPLTESINSETVVSYLNSLIDRFFKILPMRENNEDTLSVYIRSFQCEIIGCQQLLPSLGSGKQWITLLAILQYITDNPDCPISDVRREVFRAIDICSKLKAYLTEADGE